MENRTIVHLGPVNYNHSSLDWQDSRQRTDKNELKGNISNSVERPSGKVRKLLLRVGMVGGWRDIYFPELKWQIKIEVFFISLYWLTLIPWQSCCLSRSNKTRCFHLFNIARLETMFMICHCHVLFRIFFLCEVLFWSLYLFFLRQGERC